MQQRLGKIGGQRHAPLDMLSGIHQSLQGKALPFPRQVIARRSLEVQRPDTIRTGLEHESQFAEIIKLGRHVGGRPSLPMNDDAAPPGVRRGVAQRVREGQRRQRLDVVRTQGQFRLIDGDGLIPSQI